MKINIYLALLGRQIFVLLLLLTVKVFSSIKNAVFQNSGGNSLSSTHMLANSYLCWAWEPVKYFFINGTRPCSPAWFNLLLIVVFEHSNLNSSLIASADFVGSFVALSIISCCSSGVVALLWDFLVFFYDFHQFYIAWIYFCTFFHFWIFRWLF